MSIFKKLSFQDLILAGLIALSVITTYIMYRENLILLYGDAESHLNIAKRVTSSITPGMAQLGGIWLPLPHIMMLPFTYFDSLWRSGLAGSIVSGISYVIAGFYIFKLSFLVTKSRIASTVGVLVFALNPNVLYLQTTAMTELPLIAFFILSTYHFMLFIKDDSRIMNLIFAAFFGFCASLSRYDGWFLVLAEAALLIFYYARELMSISLTVGRQVELGVTANKQRIIKTWQTLEGKLLLFSVLAFLGIALWLLWNWVILKDPFYFTNSPFSAKSQQKGWLGQGELPTYHNILLSFTYYTVTSLVNIGYIMSGLVSAGLVLFLLDRKQKERLYLTGLLFVPFLFYIVTLYMGQSVIFIPELTPDAFRWNLFNVRYGVMMIPASAFYVGYLLGEILRYPFHMKLPNLLRLTTKTAFVSVFLFFIAWQTFRFANGTEKVISFLDGYQGLSSSPQPDAQRFILANYDGGLFLMDDYARTLSVIKSGVPMKNVIYIGNKPYWENALNEPEKEVQWIVMQKGDAVWLALYSDEYKQGRLFKYYEKSYTSPDILVFKRNNSAVAMQ